MIYSVSVKATASKKKFLNIDTTALPQQNRSFFFRTGFANHWKYSAVDLVALSSVKYILKLKEFFSFALTIQNGRVGIQFYERPLYKADLIFSPPSPIVPMKFTTTKMPPEDHRLTERIPARIAKSSRYTVTRAKRIFHAPNQPITVADASSLFSHQPTTARCPDVIELLISVVISRHRRV